MTKEEIFNHKFNLYFDEKGYIKPDRVCPVLVEKGDCRNKADGCPENFNHEKFSCALARVYIIETYRYKEK